MDRSKPHRHVRTAGWLVLLFMALSLMPADTTVSATTGAIRALPGFTANNIPASDDHSSPATPLGFTVNFYGISFSSLFVNNNGNITFDQPITAFTPFSLTSTRRQIIAPYFGDVDTRGLGSGIVTFGTDTVNGRPAFGVNWFNVGYYMQHTDKLNTFQLVIIDRSDILPGDFDFEFNYDQIQWESGDATGGVNGLGGDSARVGYSNGTGAPGTAFELPGSAVNGAFLDSNPNGLIRRSLNAGGQPGRLVFSVRNGSVTDPNATPTPIPTPIPTFTPTPTLTPIPTETPIIPDTPLPTDTPGPSPTATIPPTTGPQPTVTLTLSPDRDCDWTSSVNDGSFIVVVPDNAVTGGGVRCHIINSNGIYVENPGQIGVQSLINRGVQQAVDIFGIRPDGESVVPFNVPVTGCLRGDGQLVFLSAADVPRRPVGVDSYRSGDYTCTQINSSGTLVLLNPE